MASAVGIGSLPIVNEQTAMIVLPARRTSQPSGSEITWSIVAGSGCPSLLRLSIAAQIRVPALSRLQPDWLATLRARLNRAGPRRLPQRSEGHPCTGSISQPTGWGAATARVDRPACEEETWCLAEVSGLPSGRLVREILLPSAEDTACADRS